MTTPQERARRANAALLRKFRSSAERSKYFRRQGQSQGDVLRFTKEECAVILQAADAINRAAERAAKRGVRRQEEGLDGD